MIEFFNPTDAPAPGAFSRATRAGGLVFVSGSGTDLGGAAHPFACVALGPDAGRAP